MILLDTNLLARFMSEGPTKEPLALDDLEWDELRVSCMSIAEINRGLRLLPPGKRRQSLESHFERQVMHRFLDRVIDFSSDLAVAWGHIMATEYQRGNRLSEADGIIAATAFAHDALLLTYDKQLLEVSDIRSREP